MQRLCILTWLQAAGDVMETERQHYSAVVGSFEASSKCQHHKTFHEPKASASNVFENDSDWLIAAAGVTEEPSDQWGGCSRWSASEADTLSPSIELIHLIKVQCVGLASRSGCTDLYLKHSTI